MKNYTFRISCGDGKPFEIMHTASKASNAEMALRKRYPTAKQVTLIKGVPVKPVPQYDLTDYEFKPYRRMSRAPLGVTWGDPPAFFEPKVRARRNRLA
jgi:hypothetical protein